VRSQVARHHAVLGLSDVQRSVIGRLAEPQLLPGLGATVERVQARVSIGPPGMPTSAGSASGMRIPTLSSRTMSPRRSSALNSEAVKPWPSAQSLMWNSTLRKRARIAFCAGRSARRSAVSCRVMKVISSLLKRSRPFMS
jgi:hypothetical protein